jgi:hypothetical protein
LGASGFQDVRGRLGKRWESSGRPAAEIEKVKAMSLVFERARAGAAEEHFAAQEMYEDGVAAIVSKMTQDDFNRDITILLERYRDIEAASSLGFPESTQKLDLLDKNWDIAGRWKNSPLLLWCEEPEIPPRALEVLRINAYLALAAIKRWRLTHNGKNPNDLQTAIEAAGIDQSVFDSFSGKSLFMNNRGAATIEVYSVGYDGEDNNGEPIARLPHSEFSASSNTKLPDGDIVFTIKINK